MKSKSYMIDITNVQKFVQMTVKFIEDIDLVSGRYVINAKSLMGILSLDLSQPVEVCIHTTDDTRAEEFFKAVEGVLK